jgi:hypothetical protein
MPSVDDFLRSLVQEQVEQALAPLTQALQQQGEVLSRFASAFGGAVQVKRGPGRPRKVQPLGLPALPAKAGKVGKRKAGAAVKVRASSGERLCAVIGCDRPARSKGYCAAHYQKYRMLKQTDRLPKDWVEDAQAQSVKNIILPRGRAGAKALADSRS